MKKLFTLCLALLMAALLIVPAMAAETAGSAVQEAAEVIGEAAEDAADTAETAADAVESAAEDAVDTVEDAAEEVADAVEDAAEEAADTVEEAAGKSSASSIFAKLLEQKWYTLAIVAALFVAGVILALGAKKTTWDSHRLAMGAMSIAIAFVLSCIRLYRMPQGGSITPASMLPLVIFMLACGPLQGFVAGCAYGLLQLIADPWVIHPVQMLVDYPLAFGALILGCLAALIPVKKNLKLPLAVLLAAIGRYAMAVLSGTVFFAEYAGDQNALLYSLGYNIAYLGPDTLVCMAVALIPGMSRLVDMIRGKKR